MKTKTRDNNFGQRENQRETDYIQWETEQAELELRRQREMRHCESCGEDYNPKQSLPMELRVFDYIVPPSVCPECGHEDCPTVEEYLEAHAEDGLEN